jgi:hypothetical protein
MCVLHTCDNPPCVNPNHLFLGTSLDNAQDRNRKGRGAASRAKLTPEQAVSIRAGHVQGISQGALANKYGVTRGAIWQIIHNYSYSEKEKA